MPEFLHPGVYVLEEPSGAKPIEAASTSTACFVGTSTRGRPSEPTFVTSWFQFKAAFGDLDKDHFMPLAMYQFFQNGGQRAYVVRVLPKAATTASGPLALSNGTATIEASGKGAWGSQITVRVKRASFDDLDKRFHVFVQLNGEDVESWSSLGGDEDQEKFYAAIINRDSNYIQVVPDSKGNFPTGTPTYAAALPAGSSSTSSGTTPPSASSSSSSANGKLPEYTLSLSGGGDGIDATTGEAATITSMDYTEALTTLDQVDDASLLCIPGADAGTAAAGISYVAGRRMHEIFYIVDPPLPGNVRQPQSAVTQVMGIKDFVKGLPKDSNAGLYFPWVEVSDPYSSVSGATRLAPPSGMVAGLFARTDNTRGVWKAPAGSEASLLGAVGLAAQLSDNDQDALNPIGVNCIRQFAASGIVVWGSRTLATMSDPEYRYVPVRRTANFLKVSLFRGTQWVVFEPNDEPLWSAIRFNINAFMTSQFRAGAFQGGKPDDAFFAKCDKDNNIQATIDQGQVHILVAFAPLKPAEFVILHLQQVRQD